MRNPTCPVAQGGHSVFVQGLSLDQSLDDVPCPSPEHGTNHSPFLWVG